MTTNQESEQPSTIRVAIVDDHRLVVDGIAARLASEAPAIEVVAQHASWSDLMRDPAFPVDVVVIDLNLGDGVPVSTKIRALSAAGVETVVISRHADGPSVTSALAAGALAFVAKSDSGDDLVEAIRSAAQHTTYFTATISAAAAPRSTAESAALGMQEQRALVLYAGGSTIREVAQLMGTTEETVKSYVKRARRKLLDVGINVGTRTLLRRFAVSEGWLTLE